MIRIRKATPKDFKEIVKLMNEEFSKSPFNEIEECIKLPLQEGTDILRLQGGNIEPENYYSYQGNKVEYVCYTEENLEGCIVQKPILTNTIAADLKKYSEPRIKSCINTVKQSLEDRGYEVSMKEPEINIELVPDNILVDMAIDLRITKDGTESYENIRTGISSKLYNFAMITSSIISWETRYGDSETMNYMLYYPSLKVEKKKQGDGTKIYILTDRTTEENFMFATRSFVIPAGVIDIQ